MAASKKEERKDPAEDDEIVVQVSDIEFIQGALHNAYYASVSLDLVEQYRSLETRGSTSPLTAQVEEALTKLKAMLELAHQDDEDQS